MKIKLSDIFELMIWNCIVISVWIENVYCKLCLSTLALILTILLFPVSKLEEKNENKEYENDECEEEEE